MLLIPGVIASSYPKASGAFESIATATSNGTETSITLSSIPNTYSSLQVRIIGRNNIAATDASFAQMRVNGDTGNNYAQHELWGDGASVTAGGSASISSMQYATIVRNNATSNIFGVSIIDIHDYSSTTKAKTFRVLAGSEINSNTSFKGPAFTSGFLNVTSAISTIYINSAFNNFTSETTFALYGIKGA